MTSSTWPVIGHEWAVANLERAVREQRTAHAYLISGAAHIGKATLARTLALALNCTSSDRPCDAANPCRSCRLIAAGKHPDVRLIEPEGRSLKIDQVRALQHDLALSPFEGRYRVAIFDQFEAATVEAQNALLKTLEEPPAYAVLIVLAADPELLLPTIVSRCQQIALRPLTVVQVREALMARWHVAHDQADLLAHLSGGRLGWAVTAATDQSILEARATALDDLAQLLKADRVARFAYAETLTKKDDRTRATLDLWRTWWRDVLLAASGSAAELVNFDRVDEIRALAQRINVAQARAAAEACGLALWQLDHNATARLVLEVLLLDLPVIKT
ncbi:MAG TPA: DNA polymerase III subunit delta' [Anaerolineae bacterium]|nr:DNA polymerase III subunit delta' [Anaerolineae bacterium]